MNNHRWILLERYTRPEPQASYLAVALADMPDQPPELVRHSAPAMWRSASECRTCGACDGLRWARGVLTTAGRPGHHHVVVRELDPGASSEAVIDLGPFEPVALHLVGDALFVGGKGPVSVERTDGKSHLSGGAELAWIDLASPSPKPVTLVQRSGAKAYDGFARAGDRLVALDDVVKPFYADGFVLDERGRPIQRRGDWKLPEGPNLRYRDIALLKSGPDAWTLFAIAPYGHSGGEGQYLFALPIRGDVLEVPHTGWWNPVAGRVPFLDEHVTRARRGAEDVRSWRAVAVSAVPQRVFVAAGARGCLVLPPDLSSPGEYVDLGGAVNHVRSWRDHVLALVAASEHDQLVVLDPTGSPLRVIARHALPGTYDRIVD